MTRKPMSEGAKEIMVSLVWCATLIVGIAMFQSDLNREAARLMGRLYCEGDQSYVAVRTFNPQTGKMEFSRRECR